MRKLHHLRHEAGPDHKLTEKQGPLHRQIWRVLEGMLDREPPNDWVVPKQFASFSEPLHQPHENQVILIEGRRGVGKTTLLLRIVSDCQHGCERFSDTSEADTRRSAAPRRVVALRILDLETIPGSNSLLLQLVQHLHLLAKAIWDDDTESSAEVAGLQQAWGEFLRAAAANVPPGIESRRGTLDLENFVFELEEALMSTPLVKEAFHRFMGGLVRAYQHWARLSGPPLFVLPIDDADMNPQRSSDLLSATRTLWHPNLVFLVTASVDLLRVALRGHCLAMLRAPLRAQHLSELELGWQGAPDYAARLAEQVLDKAIPTTQRFTLGSVDVWERAHLDEQVEKALADMSFAVIQALGRAPGKRGSNQLQLSLAHYLEHDRLLRHVFQVSERTFRDFQNKVLRVYESPEPKEKDGMIAEFCEDLWRTGLHQSPLLERERRGLYEAVKYNRGAGLFVDPSRVAWEADETYTRSFISHQSPWLDCHIIRTTSVRARLLENPRERPVPGAELSPLAVAALMLTTDVVADHATWRVVQNPSFGSRGITLVETEFPWGSRVARFAWPTPDWPAFIDHSVLVEVWAAVDADYLADLSLVQLSYLVAYVIARVANGRPSAAVLGDAAERRQWLTLPEPDKIEAALHVQLIALLTEIGSVAQRTRIDPTRNAANRRWAAALWLFTYPEYVGVDAGHRPEENRWANILAAVQAEAARKTPIEGREKAQLKADRLIGTERLQQQMAERALSQGDYKPASQEARALLEEISRHSLHVPPQANTPVP